MAKKKHTKPTYGKYILKYSKGYYVSTHWQSSTPLFSDDITKAKVFKRSDFAQYVAANYKLTVIKLKN